VPSWTAIDTRFLCACAKSNCGPELMLNRDPGVLEATVLVECTLFVCVST
jgi:hypothetical protein